MAYISFNPNGDPVKTSVAAMDQDGDSLSYELGTCYTDSVTSIYYGAFQTPQQPLGSGWNVSLDPVTGELIFEST